MKNPLLTLFSCAALVSSVPGQLLFSDSFDAADNANFDGSPTTGRLSGALAADVVLRSWGAQQDISTNQLLMPAGGNSGVRFENAAGPFGAANRFNWAAGTTGADILAAGGFVVEFDWFPVANTSTNWISFQVGTVNADSGNLTNDDYGVLFRQNGNTERFDNSVNLGAGGSFTASAAGTVRQVKIVYEFSSFADGESVTATSSVDGIEVASDTFTWDGNSGEMRMELGNNDAGNRADNLQVSTLASGGFSISLTGTSFFSSAATGEAVGTLSAAFNNVVETAVFNLVAGAGDTDNAKFQISGDELQVGSSFSFLNEPDGSQYSVRISGLGDVSGQSAEQEFIVTLIADADADALPDAWEIARAGDTATLSGLGGADADADMLTDLQEWQLDITSYPGIDPTNADTDGDTLNDGAEIAGAGARGPTSPIDGDSDNDSLPDDLESNSGTFVDASDPGTDPNAGDSDADGYRDGFEVLRGGNPVVAAIVPPLSPAVSLTVLTDDASSDIDSSKTYTHAISGGGAATINGVLLEDFSPTVTPANFAWDTGTFSMNQVPAVTNRDWNPVAGGVTGLGLQQMLGGFTFSGSGSNAAAMQSFTLSGLTPGQSYSLRLYVRVWAADASGRPADLSFTNGAVVDYAPILEDRPAIVIGGGASSNAAYMLEYNYVAAGTDVVVASAVPPGALSPSGSYHLYGLTNEVGGPAAPVVITAISYDPVAGSVSLTYDGQPGKTYALDFSTKLAEGGIAGGWSELDDAVMSTGVGSIVTDSIVAGTAPAVFYRLRDTDLQPSP